jgi:hypothetical protein
LDRAAKTEFYNRSGYVRKALACAAAATEAESRQVLRPEPATYPDGQLDISGKPFGQRDFGR